jgi:hypothetical protein
MGKPLIPVATYMASVIEDHRDANTDEIDCTALAEDAAGRFDLMGGPPTYDTPEWVFGMAHHVAERDEARRAGIVTPTLGHMVNRLESDWF